MSRWPGATSSIWRPARGLFPVLTLSTNGTHAFGDYADRVTRISLDYAGISIDGIGITKDGFRGVVGACDMTLVGVHSC